MTDLLPAVEIEPLQGPARASVLWLHGLGADGHDFEPVIPALKLPASLAIRFVLPHAPSLPVTVNNGYVMPAWYDILAFGEERQFNHQQLLESAARVHALIDREIARGVPSYRILLAGFSQGGAVNFEAALTYPQPLAGVLALSTYFPTAYSVQPHRAQAGLPVNILHGTADPIVSPGEAEGYAALVERRLGRAKAEQLLAIYYIPGMGHGGAEYDASLGAQIDALEQWIDYRQSGGKKGAPAPASLSGYPRQLTRRSGN